MKRIISFILVIAMLSSVAIISAFAEATETEYLYRDKFVEYELQSYQELLCYEELYHHKDADGNIDAVVIMAHTNIFEEMQYDAVIADVYIHLDSMYTPFPNGYCIYDVKKDKFLGLSYYINYDSMDEYINKNIGIPLGDADIDGELTVLDATFIQRAIAGLCAFSYSDYLGGTRSPVKYISDYDRDGERTILDATAIQMKLAKKKN